MNLCRVIHYRLNWNPMRSYRYADVISCLNACAKSYHCSPLEYTALGREKIKPEARMVF